MKEKLISAGQFARDHWWIVAGAVAVGILFFHLHYFSELAYATIRFAGVLFVASIGLRYGPWRNTVRKYIDTDAFIAEFHAQDAKHKCYQVFGLIITLLVVSALCFVHP